MSKLSKIKLISSKDFNSALFGPITFNGVTHRTLAEFYDVKEEEKETLFEIQNKINSLYTDEKQSIDMFLKNLTKIDNDLKKIKDSNKYIIISNGSSLFVHLKCELKSIYQTSAQLKSVKF